MSFSPDILKKKLASLQETQDSIVTISQWVLFHHRHSKESAQLWSNFILDPSNNSNKILSLLYLCNDVVQQARHKRRTEFIIQFGKVLPNVLNKVYSSLDTAVKPKVDRLINVWEQRSVFQVNDIKAFRKAVELSKTNKSFDSATETPSSSDVSKDVTAPELKHLNNIFLRLNETVASSQANLTQVGIQSSNYLVEDPSLSDNLPSPKIYISKLNILEKLCNISLKNIDEIKKDRAEIIGQLDNLKSIISEGLNTDEMKISILNSKLSKLNSTRAELQGMIDEESEASSSAQHEIEEPSPEFDDNNNNNNDDDDDDDAIPTYESNDSDNEEPPLKKSRSSSLSSQSQSAVKKSVAFSEEIEVKEYERDEQSGIADLGLESYNNRVDIADKDGEVSLEFEKHHKDVLELKHEHDNELERSNEQDILTHSTDEDDDYDPSSAFGNGSNNNDPTMDNNVLNLLSKLA